MPASSPARTVAIASLRSAAPYDPEIAADPSPATEVSGPLAPRRVDRTGNLSVLAGVVVGVIGHAEPPVRSRVQRAGCEAALVEQMAADASHRARLAAHPHLALAGGELQPLDRRYQALTRWLAVAVKPAHIEARGRLEFQLLVRVGHFDQGRDLGLARGDLGDCGDRRERGLVA